MAIKVFWGDNLERLADEMFRRTPPPRDPFDTECTLVGSDSAAGWLRQFYLYELPPERKPHQVLANWHVQPLHAFVNDWLAHAVGGVALGARRAGDHPYARDTLQWRIWRELQRPEVEAYQPLRQYAAAGDATSEWRLWGLAGRLARLLDDYQNYRPELLAAWAEGGQRGLEPHHHWQATLWRALLAEAPDAYPAQFDRLIREGLLEKCGLARTYRRISIFNILSMPPAYLQFFVAAGKIVPVELYAFNPSREFWIEDPGARQHLRELARGTEPIAWIDPPHPLLGALGQGVQAFLASLLDTLEGQVDAVPAWGGDADQTLLQRVQGDIRRREGGDPQTAADGSIQLHACHSPLRETEVVRDLILKWFEEHPGAEPRDVQVLVPDFNGYLPFVESVFEPGRAHAALPAVLGRHASSGSGSVADALRLLLRLHESRMTAPEVLSLLELDPVRAALGVAPGELDALRGMVREAGIRWGRDRAHVARLLGQDDPADTLTWRRGLDRLLAGFAIGRRDDPETAGLPVEAGALGPLLPWDAVEGTTARLTELLGVFYQRLCRTADELSGRRSVRAWQRLLEGLLDRFFLSTESTFQELATLRRTIAELCEAGVLAGDPLVGGTVMADALESRLEELTPSGNAAANAVLFAPLRTMQPTPRRLIVLMGLNEGTFPRGDERPEFDLLGRRPRYGDRSLRREDRLAFLEALMSARDRLILTWTGRGNVDNSLQPPSPVVTEFAQYLGEGMEVVEHRLHGFDPEYFQREGQRFSYSQSDYEAALALRRAGGAAPPSATATAAAPHGDAAAQDDPWTGEGGLSLDEVYDFFRNPARWHYREILQARLVDSSRDCLDDTEPFDSVGLERYSIYQSMVASLSRRRESAAARDAWLVGLQESALLPPGDYGRARGLELIEKFEQELAYSPWPGSRSLIELLRAQQVAGMHPMERILGDRPLSGSLPLLPDEDPPKALYFRPSGVKARDLLRGWLGHLAAQAAGVRCATLVLGTGEGKNAARLDAWDDPAPAGKRLLELLELCRRGVAAPLPFAPETSLAYLKSLDGQGDEAVALGEAEKVWRDREYARGEILDPYLFAVWGESGPMRHPDFGGIARTVWQPFLEARA